MTSVLHLLFLTGTIGVLQGNILKVLLPRKKNFLSLIYISNALAEATAILYLFKLNFRPGSRPLGCGSGKKEFHHVDHHIRSERVHYAIVPWLEWGRIRWG